MSGRSRRSVPCPWPPYPSPRSRRRQSSPVPITAHGRYALGLAAICRTPLPAASCGSLPIWRRSRKRSRKVGMLRRDRQHLHDEGASAGSGVGMARPNRYPQPEKLTGRPSLSSPRSSSWDLKAGVTRYSRPIGQPPGQITKPSPLGLGSQPRARAAPVMCACQ